jgi:large subunit ribosomal protein L3
MELLGRKVGMTQLFDENGDRIPVTVVEAGPCVVVQKKTVENDGYLAVQFGFQAAHERRTSRPLLGHFKKAGSGPKRHLFEVRLSAEEAAGLEVGQEFTLASGTFQPGQKVDVTGRTRGRGFSGVVRRWNFPGKGHSHGAHEVFRHGGSVGAGSYPGRIFPGLRMAGQYGDEQVTTRNLRVVRVDAEKNLLFLRGAVPGHTNAIVRVRPAVRG